MDKYLNGKIDELKDILSGKALDIFNEICGLHEVQTIINEEYFSRIVWSREDVEVCLADNGYKPTENNINHVLNSGLGRTLKDQSISIGWEIISDVISMESDGLEKMFKKSNLSLVRNYKNYKFKGVVNNE